MGKSNSVLLIRNADSKLHSSFNRTIDSLKSFGFEKITILDRVREKSSSKYPKRDDNGVTIYSIMGENSKSIIGKMMSVFLYQFSVFKFLFGNRHLYEYIYVYDFDSGFPVYLMSKILKRKYIYHIADFYSDSRIKSSGLIDKVLRKLEKIVMKNSFQTILCTQYRYEQIAPYKYKNISVVHNSIVEGVTTREPHKNNLSDIVTISYVGGLSNNRFIEELLDIVSETDYLQLEIAGYGPLENRVEQYSDQYDNIKFHGKVAYIDSFNIYKNSDIIFAVYSPEGKNTKYSAPNKFYESLYLGIPILVAQYTGVDNLVSDTGSGVSVRYNIDDVKKILHDLSLDRERLATMSNNAFAGYKEYSWETQKETLHNIYRSMISSDSK